MTDNTLYLILHKVRGEAAYDVASKLAVNGEIWWIIPTSGHRAYPYRHWNLEDLSDISDINSAGYHDRPASLDHTLPDNWPDHYQASEVRAVQKPAASSAAHDISLLFS